MTKKSFYIVIIKSFKYLILFVLALVFLLSVIFSLNKRMHYDLAFMNYIAYLINEHEFVPYRDIFEINMPVSYLFHIAIGKLLGYSDIASNIANLIWLSIMVAVTWLIMKQFDRLIAFTSCILFGCIYIQSNFYMERDMIAVLPIATTILLSIYLKNTNLLKFKYFLIGVLFGVAAMFKPHLILGFPFLMIYNFINDFNNDKKNLILNYLKNTLLSLLGFSLIIFICILWLWQIDALESFWQILSSYTPLYTRMTRELQSNYLSYLFNSYRSFGGYGLLIVTSVLGVYIVLSEAFLEKTKRLSILLLFLAFIYSLYVVISGRFLGYHWAPYVYFTSLCTALVLFNPKTSQKLDRILFPLIVFIFTVTLTIGSSVKSTIAQFIFKIPPQSNELYFNQADEITNYLKKSLIPGSLVQPLNYCSGHLYGMLKSNAVIATPYIVDFYFYHHTSNKYIKRLRKDFIQRLKTQMPTFIIRSLINEDSCVNYSLSTFPELYNFIEKNYTVDYASETTIIYKNIKITD
ncbi:hypothetical protein [Geminocystis sp. NIES-3709]|uniref:hypothetical protein n=1 Tax=Geminocystis sp. NIES-3709 TaxID=1617448 RepID=UPI0005FC3FD5|nr:hypothetical protein [Geminocystis sp. NIES-3709]BAQ63559.1 hypothetical protein GM3709_324 [Geminocystis sp. NIES-3709]